ncbi:hypothetical protein EYC98_00285 [Halieaceae bacterium IMCC14734]|uniref:Uncharacterized protein n=1 Tax=Candidatus Litorirhabdus singularis TaxID=2518993 RepID=A0ABT3TAH6_9GAMM|nr:hypothetical protein [Candidatus Litorirhabdus singularis]MCX2979298.1 hypothetical protein [Candidatus Litorirhabdus singularis]
MTVSNREFSEQELANAGRLTVDLIGEACDNADTTEITWLVERFRVELMTMFFSYSGWERNILGCIEKLGSAEIAEQALQSVEDYEIAPERRCATEGVAADWNTRVDALLALNEQGKGVQLVADAQALRVDALALHDSMMSRVVALLSIAYRQFGEAELNWVFSQVMRTEGMDGDGNLSFREKVENIMQFTRCHMLPFTVTEDDHKVTFMPDPCPSGARLIREGHYDKPRDNAIVTDQSALTYGRREFPIYCCHEPSMELTTALRTGVPLFIVDPPEDVGISPCKVYIYKDPANIPEKYYHRLGIEKPADLIATSQ